MSDRRYLALPAVLLLCACTADLSRGVYEGVRLRNEAPKPGSADNAPTRTPAYEDYERERRALSRPQAGQN